MIKVLYYNENEKTFMTQFCELSGITMLTGYARNITIRKR